MAQMTCAADSLFVVSGEIGLKRLNAVHHPLGRKRRQPVVTPMDVLGVGAVIRTGKMRLKREPEHFQRELNEFGL